MTKSDREIMEILESYDLTRCAHSAAQLAGCDAKTVSRYVALRDAGGGDPLLVAAAPRPKLIDAFLPKVEELVDLSKAKIRADKVHERLVAMGFTGTERTTRRAVREAKIAWRAGRRRTYRPWMAEPGLWLQFDWGDGPRIAGRKTYLFCAWLAWPMSTTQIARDLGQSPASVNEHLAVLRDAGLVTRRRSGRSVLYRQTPLAEYMLRAQPDTVRVLGPTTRG